MLHCLVVLPDKSTMYIPAEWTNFGSAKSDDDAGRHSEKLRSKNISIGSVSDLLRMRLIIDALLNPPVCLDHAANASKGKEESNRAIETSTSRRKGVATTNGVGGARTGRAGGAGSNSRKNLSQVNRSDAPRSKRRRTSK